jgi:hypothetical protein
MARRARALLVTTPESPVVLDSLQRGSVDIWPIQRATPADLAAEIARGEHDAYLSDLLAAERTQRAAPVVLQAIAARRGRAGGGSTTPPSAGPTYPTSRGRVRTRRSRR